MILKTKKFILFPKSELPDIIDDPKELIIKITKKVTINSNTTNLNDVFQWLDLAEKILKRYSDYDEKLIMDLKYNMAWVFIDKLDYNKAENLLKDVIKMYCKQGKPDNKKLSDCYWCMAIILRLMGDYEKARTNILNAMKITKNKFNYHCEYAEILYRLGNIKEAEENFKKALEISAKKKAKTQIVTAVILSRYGEFLLSIGKKDLAIKNMNNAYSILKNTLGKDNLYTVRVSGHISNFLYMEKKYAEAFEKMKAAFLMIKTILGDDNTETLICKNNCSRLLVKMKKYGEAADYLVSPFVITDNKEKMALLAYNKSTMIAPELFISKTGPAALRINKILERKNIPIIENKAVANAILTHCNQFEPIPEKFYKPTAKILARTYKALSFSR